ncbi:metallophosphoesterase family protein [Altererythrobacter arenosus]|uniref:Metallophosphoesterase family protein n=1 Tax=Altererythrobacter arenosus TaxID=3032592 RepID=A0ABY8G037_9SPHN|nr:metallophosphoesterase family protein [Altererythrobacter sp. CAU 1644]WFL79006.1 metallophosphoesterase family protein [Altererythrobacter sp. CAU 1644]
MFEPLRKIFRSTAPQADMPCVPDGQRYYVVGDIHGRLDLLEKLADAIEDDDRRAGTAETTVVLLGDLVDRGPESAGVLRFAREWQARRLVRILAGNHEEMFLESFVDQEVLRHFLKHGGRETILSYGIPRSEFNGLSMDELFEKLPELVPQIDRDFMMGFEELIVAGDYAFVHAGIDPTRPLDQQKRRDMLWIRDRFLRHEGALPKVIVHGHTIFDEVHDCGNRIGIDTGAFRSGILTALVLEGDRRRTIQSVEVEDRIVIENEGVAA